MMRPTIVKLTLGCAFAGSLFLAEVNLDGGFLVNDAKAWRGVAVARPVTPIRPVGVAQHTTRRIIVVTPVYVPALPYNCPIVVINGATLYQCGTTYYQTSGSQYVVVEVN